MSPPTVAFRLIPQASWPFGDKLPLWDIYGGDNGSILCRKPHRQLGCIWERLKQTWVDGTWRVTVPDIKSNKPVHFRVHHLILLAWKGPPPSVDKKTGRHLNDNPHDNCPENLDWGTPRDNRADLVRNNSLGRTAGRVMDGATVSLISTDGRWAGKMLWNGDERSAEGRDAIGVLKLLLSPVNCKWYQEREKYFNDVEKHIPYDDDYRFHVVDAEHVTDDALPTQFSFEYHGDPAMFAKRN